jgi:hypothetical protein
MIIKLAHYDNTVYFSDGATLPISLSDLYQICEKIDPNFQCVTDSSLRSLINIRSSSVALLTAQIKLNAIIARSVSHKTKADQNVGNYKPLKSAGIFYDSTQNAIVLRNQNGRFRYGMLTREDILFFLSCE